MRPKDRNLWQQLESELHSFDSMNRPLLGIRNPARRVALLEQILESIHRVKFVSVIKSRDLSNLRTDPNSDLFDPLRAAILYQRQGNIEEAFWLVFLFVHFGKNARAGWRYAREIYGRLGYSVKWDWINVSTDPSGFRTWLHSHQMELKRNGVPRGFGNHRKYQSLDAYSTTGTGAAVESYVRWVGSPRTHQDLMEQAYQQADRNPYVAFDKLYHSMCTVVSFGRTARFDYLTMVGKLSLAPIEPGSTYMQNSTGPIMGAHLLFFDKKTTQASASDLDSWLVDLDTRLHVGMQVIEDALCNWQKCPEKFKPFRG
jgi:hypothetical protein